MIFKYHIAQRGGQVTVYDHGKYSEKKGTKQWSRNKFGKHVKLQWHKSVITS